ncbi:hypothetical protein CHCC20335_0202 [Bacillus paralicheniformis]|nr:hypothetical protein CHCC20335_0202 [Bacillus paralicheniformis]
MFSILSRPKTYTFAFGNVFFFLDEGFFTLGTKYHLHTLQKGDC